MYVSKRWILRGVLTALCALAVGFILYNSLQPAVESAAQSSRVVSLVQRVAVVIAPNSAIANATGEAYQLLHEIVRTLAHFSEYALLGALGGWCCMSYTVKKTVYGIPMVGVIALSMVDEWLQTFTAGRGAQWLDVLVDVAGGWCGVAFAVMTVWMTMMIVKRRKHETR